MSATFQKIIRHFPGGHVSELRMGGDGKSRGYIAVWGNRIVIIGDQTGPEEKQETYIRKVGLGKRLWGH